MHSVRGCFRLGYRLSIIVSEDCKTKRSKKVKGCKRATPHSWYIMKRFWELGLYLNQYYIIMVYTINWKLLIEVLLFQVIRMASYGAKHYHVYKELVELFVITIENFKYIK